MLVGLIMLLVMRDGLALICKLGVMRGSGLMLSLRYDNSLTITLLRLHGNRNSQRIAAEQRKPDRQENCSKFFEQRKHAVNLAVVWMICQIENSWRAFQAAA